MNGTGVYQDFERIEEYNRPNGPPLSVIQRFRKEPDDRYISDSHRCGVPERDKHSCSPPTFAVAGATFGRRSFFLGIVEAGGD
jgi:hypothetical protein